MQKAALLLFEEFNILPGEIDFLMLCTQSPDYFLPTSACIIQDKLGIPTSAEHLISILVVQDLSMVCYWPTGLGAREMLKMFWSLQQKLFKIHTPKDKGNRPFSAMQQQQLLFPARDMLKYSILLSELMEKAPTNDR
jgi:3-oxoacyl-[acyl-carrier-protein] synthase-3